jgi:molybdopterin synthase catalytic subunit
MFELTESPIEPRSLTGRADGAQVVFEGLVRDHNDGRAVTALDYEAMAPVAVKEGNRIIEEAKLRFGVTEVHCVHRVGALQIGDVAVRVTVASPHRCEAFQACQFVIDEVKRRVPIWKRERYADGTVEWVNAAEPTPEGPPSPAVFVDCVAELAKWTLIDVREPDVVATDPITGFEHHVSPSGAFDRALLQLGNPLLVCDRGITALILADDLWREGHRNVRSLTGGVVTLRHIARKAR